MSKDMRSLEDRPYDYRPKQKYIVYCTRCGYRREYKKIPKRKGLTFNPVTSPEKFLCPYCKTATLRVRVRRPDKDRITEPVFDALKYLLR